MLYWVPLKVLTVLTAGVDKWEKIIEFSKKNLFSIILLIWKSSHHCYHAAVNQNLTLI